MFHAMFFLNHMLYFPRNVRSTCIQLKTSLPSIFLLNSMLLSIQRASTNHLKLPSTGPARRIQALRLAIVPQIYFTRRPGKM